MKATGEVMAIDRTFEAALRQGGALAGVRRPLAALGGPAPGATSTRATTSASPTDERLWAVLASLRRGATVDELSQLSGIDPWFLAQDAEDGGDGAAPAGASR